MIFLPNIPIINGEIADYQLGCDGIYMLIQKAFNAL